MSATKEITLEEANAVVLAHREAEYAERARIAQQYVGRFYKYRNSYGPDEKWWLYGVVTEITELGWPKGLSFQRTSDDRIEVRTDDSIHIQSGGWEEITAGEFEEEARAIRYDLIVRLTPPFGTSR